jgi:hypothetical protein
MNYLVTRRTLDRETARPVTVYHAMRFKNGTGQEEWTQSLDLAHRYTREEADKIQSWHPGSTIVES